jgi:solute carrier family 50 protein (sugar transporter)
MFVQVRLSPRAWADERFCNFSDPFVFVAHLSIVATAAGMVTGNLMWTAPIRAVHRATREGRLGDLNPTPWAFMAGNCVGWVTYSFLIRNLFVFFANVFGFLLSIWLNMQAIKLQYGDFRSNEVKRSIVLALEQESRRSFVARPIADGDLSPLSGRETPETPPAGETKDDQVAAENSSSGALIDFARVVWNVTAQNSKAPVAHEIIVLVLVSIWVSVISVISYGGDVITLTTRQLVVGIIVNANLIFFYGAPLSTIFQVLRTRNSSSIHLPTMITNTANGIFWCAFGVAVMDWFILVPNGLGALLGGVQGALCVFFPRTADKSVLPSVLPGSDKTPEAATYVDAGA